MSIDMFPEGFINYVLAGGEASGKPFFAVDQVWTSEGDRSYLIVSVDKRFLEAPIIARRLDYGVRYALPVAFDLDGQQIDGSAKLVRRLPDRENFGRLIEVKL